MHGCTIATRRSLAPARTLACSFLDHHPAGSFSVLVLDDEEGTVGDGERFHVLRPSDTGIDAKLFRRLAFLRDPSGLSLAVTPWLLGELLARGRADVLLLAPECWVLGAFDELPARANGKPFLAAPLLGSATARPATLAEENAVRTLGSFDPGFLLATADAASQLEWWRATVASHIVPAVDFRPVERLAVAGHVSVLIERAQASSLLSLQDRPVEVVGDGHTVGRESLRLVHFLNVETGPQWLSPGALREYAGGQVGNPGLAHICREYANALELNGFDACRDVEYGFDRLPSGLPVDDRMRWLYWYALYEAEAGTAEPPPEPFDPVTAAGFLGWLNDMCGASGISRYLGRLLDERPDLQARFPRVPGDDSRRFLDWARDSGAAELGLDARLLPASSATADARPAAPPTTGLEPGLNVVGPFDCAHGLGEASRQILRAAREAGIPTSTALSSIGISRPDLVFEVDGLGGARFDVNLLCVNVNEIADFARTAPLELFEGRYSIGFWWWEVSKLSEDLIGSFDLVDEVWAGSDFVRDSLAAYTDKPVIAIPFAPEFPSIDPRPRAELGLPEGFVFLFVFDFYSRIERKNPNGLVRAFKEAFAPDEGASLVLKSVNGARELDSLERLRYEVGDRPDIVVVDGYLPAGMKDEWLASCDCYASLHRSEGFGLTIAEAMAFGKPVIATAYSGNMSFMTEESSYLVPFDLTTVPETESLYPAGAVWADPDIDAAARMMRHVFEHPEEAAVLGAKAAARVRAELVPRRAGEVVRERLAAIRASR